MTTREIFKYNLNYYIGRSNKNKKVISEEMNIPYTTLVDWANGNKFPRADGIERLANYFKILKSDLLEERKNNSFSVSGTNITILDGKIRKIPLFESVAAGFGCCANNQIIDFIPLMIDSDTEAEETICIRVSGDSMYPKIEDGDIISVHKQDSIDSGCIGVFLVDNEEGLVKKANYIYGEDWLELLSLNPEYMPRRFDGPDVERVKVLGLVKQVIKNI